MNQARWQAPASTTDNPGDLPWVQEDAAVSRSLSPLKAMILGLFVLIGTGLAVTGLFAVGSRGWFGKDALHVRVGFPEIRGVEVGTRVRIQGIDAGEVLSITPPADPSGLVELRLRLKGQYRHLVRTNSTVQIASEGMLGGKVVEIRPPTGNAGGPAGEDAVLRSEPSTELADVLGQVGKTLTSIQNGNGTLGKLANDPQAYDALLALLRNSNQAVEQSKDAIAAVGRDAEAFKRLPFIGRYVEDPLGLLVRTDRERNRKYFAEEELFEPGRAGLTAQGRDRLDKLAPWLEGLKHKGSEVVVVAYADPKQLAARPALEITRQQSAAVVAYLKKQHSTHKMGLLSSRKVTALGQGVQPPPVPERDPLPPARIEVLVFVPQG
jgi:phospholipid/cholesterol/gamma-HCH transport system substrate-binding protein